MHIIFVHGWSVTHTDTYGDLPRWLAQQSPQYTIQNVYLGKYISFVDTITVDDIARAFEQALVDALGSKINDGFACITHSTGGPVVRLWMKLKYEANLGACPMKHLIMLAPANHGSALAQLGKGVLSRLKSLTEGVEPGVRVLDWLELGSDQAWGLNKAWLDYDWVAAGVYPFVLTGQSIDRSFYDHLNSYTGEPGSDGVVRAAAANLNYTLFQLHQEKKKLVKTTIKPSRRTAFGILPGRSHSGEKMGIIRSVKLATAAQHPTAQWVLRCLQVTSAADYTALCDELDQLTTKTQRDERKEEEKKFFGTKTYETSRYAMLIFRFIDDRDDPLTDYDLYLTGGPNYSPDDLPEGFFVDRQRNRRNPGKLTYFIDRDKLHKNRQIAAAARRIGLKVVARPVQDNMALAFYEPAEFRSDEDALADYLRPNETVMIEVQLARCVDATVFRVEDNLTPSRISPKPSGQIVP